MLRFLMHVIAGAIFWWLEPARPWLWVFGYFALMDTWTTSTVCDVAEVVDLNFAKIRKELLP